MPTLSFRRSAALRKLRVVVTLVDVDMWLARCVAADGSACFADHRSTLSITALREGERLVVLVTPLGLIKQLAAA